MKKPIIIAMVPAKMGSTRLKMKNLALLNGKPLIYYAIEAARKSRAFGRIVVNAEDEIFRKIAKRYGVDFYLRPAHLVKPTTKTDFVVYDFLSKNPCDIVAWVSPIAPFQSSEEVKRLMNYFIKERFDSLMTVKDEQVHCIYNGRPVNFNSDEVFTQTQDLLPVRAFVYTTMVWRSRIFMRMFKKRGYALMCGKVGVFSVSRLSSIIIKKREDLELAQHIMRFKKNRRACNMRYDRLVGERN